MFSVTTIIFNAYEWITPNDIFYINLDIAGIFSRGRVLPGISLYSSVGYFILMSQMIIVLFSMRARSANVKITSPQNTEQISIF